MITIPRFDSFRFLHFICCVPVEQYRQQTELFPFSATISGPNSSADEDEFPHVEGVPSWFDQQPGERLLRKNNVRMGNADVYKQHKLQEEDMLTQDRLKKGYQVSYHSHPLGSPTGD